MEDSFGTPGAACKGSNIDAHGQFQIQATTSAHIEQTRISVSGSPSSVANTSGGKNKSSKNEEEKRK